MIRFSEFLNETLSDQELDSIANHLTWNDIADLYEDDEFINEELDESLSAQSRLKKAQRFKSRKTVVGISRKMKLKRASNLETLHKRASAAARRMLQKRILGGRSKQHLSASQKDRVEKQIKSMMASQGNLAQKLLPKIKLGFKQIKKVLEIF
jgi:hypothetical protein